MLRRPRFRASILLAGLAMGALILAADAAWTSDYMHVCRTADGAYEIDDGALFRSGDNGEARTEIPYATKSETVLWRETGYCLSEAAKGQRFQYESKVYALRISFKDGAGEIETTAICELAADGLPAAYTCDKQVVVTKEELGDRQSRASAEPQAKDPLTKDPLTKDRQSFWMHNGSVMRLEADGARRRFLYEAPRPGMREAGAKRGTVLFAGERQGNRYAGTAYVFARGCAPFPYRVEGPISVDERRVVMRGAAPRVRKGCAAQGTIADRLAFERMPDFAP